MGRVGAEELFGERGLGEDDRVSVAVEEEDADVGEEAFADHRAEGDAREEGAGGVAN